MSRVIILGGCGAVGSVAAKTLAGRTEFDQVRIADLDSPRAEALCEQLRGDGAVAELEHWHVDVSDAVSLSRALEDVDLIVNCTGPFYRFVRGILSMAIEKRVDYIDVCDDVDVTLDILEWHERAKAAGVRAVIGLGSSPGSTNLIAKYAAEQLLDETDAIDIYHAHGGEKVEGAGVVAHRFHCMSIDVPMYLDGALKHVRFFEPEGQALQQEVDFGALGEAVRVYPYPHPEQVTLPKHIKTRQVTNRGTVLPASYYELTKDICALGLGEDRAVEVNGSEVSARDFAIAYILQRREELLAADGPEQQCGCVKIVVSGKRAGKDHRYVFTMSSNSEALGEGTGIPVAVGAVLMQRGRVTEKGVLPPEACVDPLDFIGVVNEVLPKGRAEGSYQGVQIESIDADGNVEHMSL